MKRLFMLPLLLVTILVLSGCHNSAVFFADGSWFWKIGDHDPNSPNYIAPGATHATIFGCLPYSRTGHGDGVSDGGDCTVNPTTDAMTGSACLWHPDGLAGCKGLFANPDHHNINYSTGFWSYVYPFAGSNQSGCLDDNGLGHQQWPC